MKRQPTIWYVPDQDTFVATKMVGGSPCFLPINLQKMKALKDLQQFNRLKLAEPIEMRVPSMHVNNQLIRHQVREVMNPPEIVTWPDAEIEALLSAHRPIPRPARTEFNFSDRFVKGTAEFRSHQPRVPRNPQPPRLPWWQRWWEGLTQFLR